MAQTIYLKPEVQIKLNDLRKKRPDFNLSYFISKKLSEELLNDFDIEVLKNNLLELEKEKLDLEHKIDDLKSDIKNIQEKEEFNKNQYLIVEQAKKEASKNANLKFAIYLSNNSLKGYDSNKILYYIEEFNLIPIEIRKNLDLNEWIKNKFKG